jgi:hypothetical protein
MTLYEGRREQALECELLSSQINTAEFDISLTKTPKKVWKATKATRVTYFVGQVAVNLVCWTIL